MSQINKYTDESFKNKRTEEYRRQIRQRQNTISKKLRVERKELLNPDKHERLKTNFENLNKIYEDVTASREAVNDSRILNQGSELALRQVQNIVVGKMFDIDKFVENLKLRYFVQGSPSEVDWNELGKRVDSQFNEPSLCDFLSGPLQKDLKRKKRKKRVVDDPESEEEKPEILDKDNREGGSKYVNKLASKHLKLFNENRRKPVDFMDIVVDPDPRRGFTRTCENIFNFSFLVKDGLIKMKNTIKGRIVSTIDKVSNIPEDNKKKQGVVSFNVKKYKKMVEQFQKREVDENDAVEEEKEEKIEEDLVAIQPSRDDQSEGSVEETFSSSESEEEEEKKKKKKKKVKKKKETKKRRRREDKNPRKKRKKK